MFSPSIHFQIRPFGRGFQLLLEVRSPADWLLRPFSSSGAGQVHLVRGSLEMHASEFHVYATGTNGSRQARDVPPCRLETENVNQTRHVEEGGVGETGLTAGAGPMGGLMTNDVTTLMTEVIPGSGTESESVQSHMHLQIE